MSSTEQAKFTCDACGKGYAWKPELAGKKAKCKCGAVMNVPASLASVTAPPDELADMYDLVPDDAPAPRVRRPVAQAEAGPRCPSCTSGMEAGAVICVHCGFNLKTGKKMGTAIGLAEATGSPAIGRPGATPGIAKPPSALGMGLPPSIGPQKFGAANDYDAENRKKLMVLGGLGAVVVAGLFGGFVLLKKSEPAVDYKGDDKAVVEFMDDNPSSEAREFVKNKMYGVVGMSNEKFLALAERLYGMGAKEIRAFDGRASMSMLIELPMDNADARKALIEWTNRYYGREAPTATGRVTDVGQRYIRVKLKIADI